MATFLFWNMAGKPEVHLVDTLVRQHRVDVLVLGECKIPEVDLLEALNTDEPAKLSLAFTPDSSRLRILIRFPPHSLRLVRDTRGICIRRLVPPIGVDVLLVALHLPSKLHQSEDDQAFLCTRVAAYIREVEENAGHSRTIVFGDLNMNPFEHGVVAADGLHAVMSRHVAERGSRVVAGEQRLFFYNPMWSVLGDGSVGPPGTYYYDTGRQVNYYWNMFDQVLVRPDLLSRFNEGDFEVLVAAGETPLLSNRCVPTPSDHLPILFRVNLERGDRNELDESLG